MDVPRQSPFLIKSQRLSRVCFGSFELDVNSGELFSGGEKVLLQEQPLQILRMLIEANGEVVSRDAIRSRLWPNDTIVEFDHSINAAIKNLRRALDDSAQEPRYVETLARRGYRLMVKVEALRGSTLATVQVTQVANIWVAPLSDASDAKPITTGGDAWAPTWTPDNRIVYVLDEVNRTRLWMMSSDGSKSNPLPDTVGTYVFRPRVSANGQIVYGSDRSGALQIWRTDLDGSNAKQLSNNNDILISEMDASSDGKWIVYGRVIGGIGELWKVPMQGSQPVRLTHQPKYNGKFSISPDAKTIAYIYTDSQVTPPRGVALVPLEGEPKVTLLDIPADCVRWTRDGQSLLYSATQGGVSNIWERPIAGGSPKQLTHFTNETISLFDVSKDGKQLAIERDSSSSHVVLIRDVK